MIKRTLEISRDPAYLSVSLDQLQIKREDHPPASIPCEDIGVVLVDHPQVTYTHGALVKLAESDAVVVVCGKNHLPVALVMPIADHSQVVWRVNEQIAVGKPLRKQLWKQLVQAKVRAQAAVLPPDSAARRKLLALARQVRSGDPENVEARAARVYWGCWLPDRPFRRDPDGDDLNPLLNYGYAVVRAAVARAIVAAGLLPSLGLKHCHRANAFCLADDLMEPLRPLVDDRVRRLSLEGVERVDQQSKASLLELLSEEVAFLGERGPLMVNLHRFVASLVRCYRGEDERLAIPQRCK
ncbi:MAG TPA: type II CRISPR-associated endonuclease Cas1 [Pirellulales bacterium]|nr:type II CRISPR-associated endonuclease Cas1 [Pirellulales bacterium]